MKYALSLLAGMLLFPYALLSQQRQMLPTDTLAEIGTHVITARDLIERIEMMPWQGKEQRGSHDSSKVKALQSMVAETVLANEAAARGIGSDTLSTLHREAVEGAFVRDELFRREVVAKVNATPSEINAGMKKYAWTLQVRAIALKSEKAAKKAAKSLHSVTNIDSLILADFRSDLRSADTAIVNFGAADEELENVAYALTLKNRVSAPFNSSYFGWVVLYLLDGETNLEYAKKSGPDQIHAVERTIRERNELKRASQYFNEFLGPKRAEANPEVFEIFASAVLRRIGSDTLAHKKGNGYIIIPEEIDLIETGLSAYLGRVVVTMPEAGLTLGKAIEALRILQFTYPSLDSMDFRRSLSGALRVVVQSEFLAREGYRQKLDATEAVRHDTRIWSDYWRAFKMTDTFPPGEEPSEAEVLQNMIKHGLAPARRYEVNVREILTDSLATSVRCLEQLLTGADMTQLARTVSRRPGWAERGGESGFFSVATYPELGFQAMAADTGKLIGPVKLKEGYCLFRVLGKKDAPRDSGLSFDSLRSTIRSTLRLIKRQESINKFIAEHAEKQGVRFHYQNLSKVDIMPSNMFTRRFIGFGGTMTAMPILSPRWQWINEMHGGTPDVP